MFATQCSLSRQESAIQILFRRTSGFVLLAFSDFPQWRMCTEIGSCNKQNETKRTSCERKLYK